MVLARLEQIGLEELRELIVEAWLTRAPRRLARDYIATHFPEPRERRAAPRGGAFDSLCAILGSS